MMAEEKVSPPSYSYPAVMQSEPQKSSKKWLWGIVFYAGAVTAALIVVSVLGSIYVKDMKASRYATQDTQTEEEHHENKHYHDSDAEHKQDVDFDLDLTADKEVIKFTNQETGISSMAVLDFEKDMAGLYDANTDECYLIGGIDSRLPDAGQLDDLLQKQRKETRDEVKLDYVVNHERQVKNLDLLPEELLSHCWGKPVYWLEKTNSTAAGRQKRLTCDYWLYCDAYGCYIIEICY